MELTVKQAAEALGVHPKTVRRYIKQGKLHWTTVQGKYGKEYRVTRQSIEQVSKGKGFPTQPSLDRSPSKAEEELLQAIQDLTARMASLEQTMMERLPALPPAREVQPEATAKRTWWQRLIRRGNGG